MAVALFPKQCFLLALSFYFFPFQPPVVPCHLPSKLLSARRLPRWWPLGLSFVDPKGCQGLLRGAPVGVPPSFSLFVVIWIFKSERLVGNVLCYCPMDTCIQKAVFSIHHPFRPPITRLSRPPPFCIVSFRALDLLGPEERERTLW